jgi:hypothetical protein
LINLFLGPDSSRTSNTVNEIFQSESDDPSEETTVDLRKIEGKTRAVKEKIIYTLMMNQS